MSRRCAEHFSFTGWLTGAFDFYKLQTKLCAVIGEAAEKNCSESECLAQAHSGGRGLGSPPQKFWKFIIKTSCCTTPLPFYGPVE